VRIYGDLCNDTQEPCTLHKLQVGIKKKKKIERKTKKQQRVEEKNKNKCKSL